MRAGVTIFLQTQFDTAPMNTRIIYPYSELVCRFRIDQMLQQFRIVLALTEAHNVIKSPNYEMNWWLAVPHVCKVNSQAPPHSFEIVILFTASREHQSR